MAIWAQFHSLWVGRCRVRNLDSGPGSSWWVSIHSGPCLEPSPFVSFQLMNRYIYIDSLFILLFIEFNCFSGFKDVLWRLIGSFVLWLQVMLRFIEFFNRHWQTLELWKYGFFIVFFFTNIIVINEWIWSVVVVLISLIFFLGLFRNFTIFF